jgi:hypothetical protein
MTRIWIGNRYLALLCVSVLGISHARAAEESAFDSETGAIPAEDALESKVRSTLLFGGSSPVSFSGEGRLRISQHDFYNYPSLLETDQTWTQANWEGNESMLRLGMVVRANRNAVLWSKIGFQSTLPGNYIGPGATNPGATHPDLPGYTREQNRHDKSDVAATIHEDMAAGLAIRTIPASFWVRMGNVIWTEASPLTIWKSQPRTFAWDYLPFEVEQPVSRYYEYNIAKGEKSGRAAWNKKPFNGIDFRSINLPLGLQASLMYGTFERYDNFEREFIDFSNDLAYAGDATEAKQQGIGDSYRHMFHGRLAMEKVYRDIIVGLNAVAIVYDDDIANNAIWRKNFDMSSEKLRNARDSSTNLNVPFYSGSGFYKEPKVLSVDAKGSLNDNLDFHIDIAGSRVDTTWRTFGADSTSFEDAQNRRRVFATDRSVTAHSDIALAAFARLRSKYGVPVQADLAYIPKGFYSPFSFVSPQDAFFPVGSNMVGAGKFITRGEGSPYAQNMTGINLTVAPNVGYGHFRVTYGQHFQPKVARDLLYFPYRLNGQDLNSAFQSSYNRWGNNMVDNSVLSGKYANRLGDESFHTKDYGGPMGPEGGGLRSDYLSMFEGFVPYENQAQADSNSNAFMSTTTITTASPYVPQHRKFAFNLELDGALDIGPAIGYAHDLFLSGYFSVNGVSSSLRPITMDEKDMMLWGTYVRVEPAIALADKFYVLGLGGYENWRSNMAYMKIKNPANGEINVERAPIDYKDYALGIGFDWDFVSRVGLHGRYKWMKHTDEFFSANDWATYVSSAEIKMWF